MEISEHIYSFPIETTYFGTERTFHAAGIEGTDGLYLFDVGGPGDTDALVDALVADGFRLEDVVKVFTTHHDYDHVACLADLADRGSFEVIAHRNATPYLQGNIRTIKRPQEFYSGVPVDVQLTGGERFRSKVGEVLTVFTPGHGPDHLVFYIEAAGVLIAGDLLRNDSEYLGGPNPDFTLNMAAARDSMEKLLDFEITDVVCYHGGHMEATEADVRRVYDTLLTAI